jgi:hypothetical protein
MKTLLMLLALLFLPVLCLAQNGTMQQSGNMTFYNFNGTMGTSQQFGNMQSNHFNNGQSATRRQFGSMDVYTSPSPGSLSGPLPSFGDQSLGIWTYGTHSTRQNFGGMQFDTLQRSSHTTHCTSQEFSNQTFSNCP